MFFKHCHHLDLDNEKLPHVNLLGSSGKMNSALYQFTSIGFY